jgi:2-polyprenyl-3-methyl-5-hydroxy-6-metoxy-1,4-benzoquinol methylase
MSRATRVSTNEDLDRHLAGYENDPFAYANRLTFARFAEKMLAQALPGGEHLEFGIGVGVVLRALGAWNKKVTLLEGSPQFVQAWQGRYPNVDIVHTYFEDYRSDIRYTSMGMGFVLEHVDDPRGLLEHYRPMLSDDGSIFVGVPNAAGAHRRIGHMAGLIPDLRALSDVDRSFGHKRFWTDSDWLELFQTAGFRVTAHAGLYYKPLATSQLEQLQLPDAIYKAFVEFADEWPEVADSVFYQLSHPKAP